MATEPQTQEPMRVTYFEAENFQRLRAVRLNPDKTLVRIEGRNAQGKTSVLAMIEATLGGAKHQPDEPIRRGEDTAKGVVELEPGKWKVERRWTNGGRPVLELTIDGVPQTKRAQGILDEIVGDLTFDPLLFVGMKQKEQAELLRTLVGLDFSELDAKRDRLYSERTLANRDAKTAQARVGHSVNRPASDTPIDISELADKGREALEHNHKLSLLQDALSDTGHTIDRHAEQITHLQEQHAEAVALQNEQHTAILGMKRMDLSDVKTEITNAEAHNQAIKDHQEWSQRSEEAKEKRNAAAGFDGKIAAIDSEKDQALKEAKFPLKGLGINEDGTTLNGLPFSQASSAEQLRAAVAIGLAGKPRARIMLINNGSLLDNEGLDELHRLAVEYDAQVFIERVADSSSPNAVWIEDGEFVETADMPGGEE